MSVAISCFYILNYLAQEFNFNMAIMIIDIIRFTKPATINLVRNSTRFTTENMAEIAKRNTIFAVTNVTSVC